MGRICSQNHFPKAGQSPSAREAAITADRLEDDALQSKLWRPFLSCLQVSCNEDETGEATVTCTKVMGTDNPDQLRKLLCLHKSVNFLVIWESKPAIALVLVWEPGSPQLRENCCCNHRRYAFVSIDNDTWHALTLQRLCIQGFIRELARCLVDAAN